MKYIQLMLIQEEVKLLREPCNSCTEYVIRHRNAVEAAIDKARRFAPTVNLPLLSSANS